MRISFFRERDFNLLMRDRTVMIRCLCRFKLNPVCFVLNILCLLAYDVNFWINICDFLEIF